MVWRACVRARCPRGGLWWSSTIPVAFCASPKVPRSPRWYCTCYIHRRIAAQRGFHPCRTLVQNGTAGTRISSRLKPPLGGISSANMLLYYVQPRSEWNHSLLFAFTL